MPFRSAPSHGSALAACAHININLKLCGLSLSRPSSSGCHDVSSAQADPKLQAELDATNKAKLVKLDATIKGASFGPLCPNIPQCAPAFLPRAVVGYLRLQL